MMMEDSKGPTIAEMATEAMNPHDRKLMELGEGAVPLLEATIEEVGAVLEEVVAAVVVTTTEEVTEEVIMTEEEVADITIEEVTEVDITTEEVVVDTMIEVQAATTTGVETVEATMIGVEVEAIMIAEAAEEEDGVTATTVAQGHLVLLQDQGPN